MQSIIKKGITGYQLKIIGIILAASWIIMFIVEKKGIKNNVKTY